MNRNYIEIDTAVLTDTGGGYYTFDVLSPPRRWQEGYSSSCRRCAEKIGNSSHDSQQHAL